MSVRVPARLVFEGMGKPGSEPLEQRVWERISIGRVVFTTSEPAMRDFTLDSLRVAGQEMLLSPLSLFVFARHAFEVRLVLPPIEPDALLSIVVTNLGYEVSPFRLEFLETPGRVIPFSRRKG
jgi:hypothetical protein